MQQSRQWLRGWLQLSLENPNRTSSTVKDYPNSLPADVVDSEMGTKVAGKTEPAVRMEDSRGGNPGLDYCCQKTQ